MSIPPFEEIRLRAHAKINLFLEVLDRRADGYHEIDSIFVPVDLCDELSISPGGESGSLEIECDDPAVPCDGRNTVARALRAFYAGAGTAPGLRIRIAKRIPSGAGLGGGSSDAAAVLRALARIEGIAEGDPRTRSAAANVGADVPFFLQRAPARVRGIGERVEPLPGLAWPRWVVIAWPGFPVPTPWAYAELDRALTWPRPAVRIPGFLSGGGRPGEIHNDFEEIVGKKHPRIRELKERLHSLGAQAASLTGSGSAVFGIFAAAAEASRAEAALRDEGTWAARSERLQERAD